MTTEKEMFQYDCLPFAIRESFLGYQYRKVRHQLYIDPDIPRKLICMYYMIKKEDRADLDYLKKAFVQKYIKNECELELVHNPIEKDGMKIMYDYMHTTDEPFNIYSITDYHKKLYSLTQFPEYAGQYRNHDVYLPGTGTELTEWPYIFSEIRKLIPETNELIQKGEEIKNSDSVDKKYIDDLFNYIDNVIMLKCKLIKIHPFDDGNGRTIRCFLNRLFETAGIPPVYIKEKERTEYHKAMNLANCEGNYKDIIQFYYYKICDSIVELDINEQLKDEKISQQEISNKRM